MERVLYSDSVSAGAFLKFLGVFISLLLLVVLFSLGVFGTVMQNLFVFGVTASALGFLLFLFWNWKEMRIYLTDTKFSICYGVFNHQRILISDIVSCELTKPFLARFGGVGWGWDGSWAYVVTLRQGVKIIQKKGRPFVFSSRNPMKICDTINQVKTKLTLRWFSTSLVPEVEGSSMSLLVEEVLHQFNHHKVKQ